MVKQSDSQYSAQHRRILQAITRTLQQVGYKNIQHQRITAELTTEHNGIKQNQHKISCYQGLSRAIASSLSKNNQRLNENDDSAVDNQTLMLKWVLFTGTLKLQSLEQTHEHSVCFNQEIANFQYLYQNYSQKELVDLVPMLATHTLDCVIEGKSCPLYMYAMPYLEDQSIKHQLPDVVELPLAQKLILLIDMANTLSGFHELGWYHGDIKPSNFLLRRPLSSLIAFVTLYQQSSNTEHQLNSISAHHKMKPTSLTYLCDLNCAKHIETSNNRFKESNQLAAQQPNTLTGTPAYLAPECWQQQVFGVQTDIYAFGITSYEILTGVKPYRIKKFVDLDVNEAGDINHTNNAQLWAIQHCQSSIPLLASSHLFNKHNQSKDSLQQIQSILDKLLAKNKAKRYAHMQAVSADLTVVLSAISL